MICINNFETIVYIIYNILSTFVIPKYNLLLCMLFVDSLRHLTINDFYNKLCNGFMHSRHSWQQRGGAFLRVG